MKAKIYGKPNCPHCVHAKNLMASKPEYEVEYIDIVQEGINGEDLSQILGRPVRTVPQILVNDQYVGGFQELVEFFKK